MKTINYEMIKNDGEINELIRQGDAALGALGYTEHSRVHALRVAKLAGDILTTLDHDAHTVELARIAGYIHDIGNSVNRHDHAHSGAILAYHILKDRGMGNEDRATVMRAIGNHDEATGTAVDPVSAALILADKSDVRRTRVRNKPLSSFDAHDRVNYAVLSSEIEIRREEKVIQMNLALDESMCTVIDYFEIFLQRMLMCRRAAEIFGCTFKLKANGGKVC